MRDSREVLCYVCDEKIRDCTRDCVRCESPIPGQGELWRSLSQVRCDICPSC